MPGCKRLQVQYDPGIGHAVLPVAIVAEEGLHRLGLVVDQCVMPRHWTADVIALEGVDAAVGVEEVDDLARLGVVDVPVVIADELHHLVVAEGQGGLVDTSAYAIDARVEGGKDHARDDVVVGCHDHVRPGLVLVGEIDQVVYVVAVGEADVHALEGLGIKPLLAAHEHAALRQRLAL